MKRASVSLAVVGIALLVSWLIWYRWDSQRRVEVHQIARTNADLFRISQSVKTLNLAFPHAITRASLSNLNARTLYEMLVMTNATVRVLEPDQSWDSNGELLDRWGHPFRMEVSFSGESTNGAERGLLAQFKLWSVGPNGRDEEGSGDDIVAKTFSVNVGD